MLLLVCSTFLIVPVVCHVWLRDVLNGSAAAGLLIGLVCGAAAFWNESLLLGFIVLLFGACLGFAVAYVLGLLLRLFGLPQASKPESGTRDAGIAPILLVPGSKDVTVRRALVGGFGAVGLWLVMAGVGLAYRLQTGEWPVIPPKGFFGGMLLLVVGLATVVSAHLRARKRSGNAP